MEKSPILKKTKKVYTASKAMRAMRCQLALHSSHSVSYTVELFFFEEEFIQSPFPRLRRTAKRTSLAFLRKFSLYIDRKGHFFLLYPKCKILATYIPAEFVIF